MGSRELAVVEWLALALLLTGLRHDIGRAQITRYDLSAVQGIDKFEDRRAKMLLARNGFVVVPAFRKQIFEPYLWSQLPAYATTDSAFRTYHVILEEAVRDLEHINAGIITQFSKQAAQASLGTLSKAKTEEAKKAARMLAAYFSLAARLADKAFPLDERVADRVQTELKKIAAGVMDRSAILGEECEYKFDYGVFKPRGIYTGKPRLESYFRVLVLYGGFGFRAKSRGETLAAALLVRLLNAHPELKSTHDRLECCYRYFIGEPDDLTVTEYGKAYADVFGDKPNEETLLSHLPQFQEAVAQLRDPRINDQFLWVDEWLEFRKETKGLRLFGVKYVPDSELFQDLVDLKKHPMPSGLYVAAALGSPSAQRIMRKSKGERFAKKLDRASATFREQLGTSNYAKTLRCLQTLFATPPKKAPRFMKTDAWQDRELLGVLASWASIRHTWAGQTKEAMHAGGLFGPCPGYVETRPDFFRSLSALAKETAAKLDEFSRGAEIDEDRLREIAQEERLWEEHIKWDDHLRKLTQEQAPPLYDKCRSIQLLCCKARFKEPMTDEEKTRLRGIVDSYTSHPMRRLIPVLDLLASMAEKQLAGQALSKEETALLNEYGQTLAMLQFYYGNSYLEPKDDMPLIVDVYSNPFVGIEKVLEVGIGRTMPIYVIIRHGGKYHLCAGGVMSYYEFEWPITDRLTDAQWRRMVERGQARLPEWSASFVSSRDKEKILRALKKGKILPGVDAIDRARVLPILEELLRSPKRDRFEAEPQDLAKLYARFAGPDEVPLLLELMADKKCRLSLYGALERNRKIAESVLQKGAAVPAIRKQFDRALCATAVRGRRDLAELLIAHGADPNAERRNWNGRALDKPLHQTSGPWGEHADVAELLIRKGADVNARGDGGSTPLMEAAYWDHRKIAELLIRNGAEINAKASRGVTALHKAADHGNLQSVLLLIRHGADVNAKTEDGKTPLDYALAGNIEHVAELLRKHGAKSGQDLK